MDVAWRHPSTRLLLVRRLEFAVATVALAVAPFFVFEGTAGVVGACIVLGAGVVLQVLVTRRFRSWGYAEREDDLFVRRGVMFRRLSVIPYGRMQFIDVTAGPIERLFGLATVRMHTAAAASDARIPGLAADEAARVRDRLAELGEAQAAGL
jgi:membrane protein YdbS with pleckstrin-like domain